MKLILTSSGIANTSIHDALLGLLGKPIEESSALVIPTAIYPFPGGVPSIDEECWVPAIQETDALLVWGGDPVFLSYWMRRSGLADVLPSLPSETVYLGVSSPPAAVCLPTPS